jgi:hypothetical protein
MDVAIELDGLNIEKINIAFDRVTSIFYYYIPLSFWN